ncbi:MAG TPA: STAS domain-containing protein [bacterium]
MERSTQVEKRTHGDIGIIDIQGEVTSFSEKLLQDAYEKFSRQGLKKIALNFEGVSYINSAGMAIIISVLTQSRKKGQTLRAWGLSEHFQKIFDMVGITKYMTHHESESETITAFE